MPRTPAGGRLPHGPRHVPRAGVAAMLAGAVLGAGGCGTSAPSGPASSRGTGVASAGIGGKGRPAAAAITPATTPVPLAARPGSPRAGAVRHVRHVRGSVVRVSVESGDGTSGDGGGDDRHEAAIATWLQTPRGRVRVRTSTLTKAPTGSTVDAEVDAEVGSTPRPTGDALAAAESGGTIVAARVASPPPSVHGLTAGVHDVTAVLVLPPGARPDATTPARLAAAVNGPVSTYWSRQTGGRVRFHVVRATGWVRVDSRCDDAWSLWAEVSARVGFVPGPRRHLVVLVPPSAGGCFAGLGTIGATGDTGGYAYVRGTLTGLIAHELGHNLGLGHSNGLQCDGADDGTWIPGRGASAGRWTAACVRTGYRDWYDVMGISWDRLGTLSTTQAYRLGAPAPGEVATVRAPARVTLTAVGLHDGLRSLRVADPGGHTYVVEYRAALGDDAWLTSNWRGLRPGVLVRRDDPQSDPQQTLLLDGSPSPRARFATDWDETVPVGGALTSADRRVVIRVEGQTASTAQVSVEVDGVAPASGLTRLGSRLADTSTSRIVRDPVKATPAPRATPDAEVPRRTLLLPAR